MHTVIVLNGSMNPDKKLELTYYSSDDEENEICISIKDEEIDLYVNFEELKKAIYAIDLLKG